MAITIGKTSGIAMLLQRKLNEQTRLASDSARRLSSGLRISSVGDDAAGLSIGTDLKAESRLRSVSIRNLNDALGALSVAGEALNALSNITTRQQELAVQSANGSITDKQRAALNDEMRELGFEFNRIIRTAQFNGQSLLADPFGQLSIQPASTRTEASCFRWVPSLRDRSVTAPSKRQ